VNDKTPLLKIRFDGEAVGPGKIPVGHLLTFLDNMNKALARTGRLLAGNAESVRRGPQLRSIKEELALDLVLLTHGSPAAVLGFERQQTDRALPGMDLGLEIFERALRGLSAVQEADDRLPPGYDAGVLMAWRDAGTLFRKGITKIDFTLNHRATPLTTTSRQKALSGFRNALKGRRPISALSKAAC